MEVDSKPFVPFLYRVKKGGVEQSVHGNLLDACISIMHENLYIATDYNDRYIVGVWNSEMDLITCYYHNELLSMVERLKQVLPQPEPGREHDIEIEESGR